MAFSARGEEAILQFFDDDEDTWALLGELGPEKGLQFLDKQFRAVWKAPSESGGTPDEDNCGT